MVSDPKLYFTEMFWLSHWLLSSFDEVVLTVPSGKCCPNNITLSNGDPWFSAYCFHIVFLNGLIKNVLCSSDNLVCFLLRGRNVLNEVCSLFNSRTRRKRKWWPIISWWTRRDWKNFSNQSTFYRNKKRQQYFPWNRIIWNSSNTFTRSENSPSSSQVTVSSCNFRFTNM